MYALASLGLRCFLRGRRSTCCSARGRMYALASLGLRRSALLRSRSSGAGHGDVSTQLIQIDCLSAYHGFFIHDLSAQVMMLVYGTWTTDSHSLTHLLTLTHSLTLTHILLCGRRGTWCSARGRMYALASLGLRCFLRGRRSTCCSARGRMYDLASLGLRRSAGNFCVAGAALAALQGVGCMPWRPLVSAALPVGFAWQAQHLLLCKGSDVRPGVPWSPLLFAWQAQHLLLCKGSDVRPGVPWSPLLFAWQAQHLVLCKGSDVRTGVLWSPPLCSAQVTLFRSRARRCINSAHSD